MDWYRRRPLLWWGIFIIAGMLGASVLPEWMFFILIVFIVILFIIYRVSARASDTLVFLILILTMISLGAFRHYADNVVPNPILKDLASSDTDVLFTGVVKSIDTTSISTLHGTIEPLSVYDHQITAQPVQIWLPENIPLVTAGDTITGLGNFSRFPRARNPGEFDYRKYQELRHQFYQVEVKHPWEVKIRSGEVPGYQRLVQATQDYITTTLNRMLSSSSANFATALVLGQRDAIDDRIIETFSSLGVIHVMAVSGLHVGFVTLVLMVIGQVFRLPFRYRVAFAIVGLAYYAALVEFRPSVVRASIMAGVLLLAEASEKRYDILNLLGLAAIIILLVNPGELFSLGFQLSFLAVLSIVLLYDRMQNYLENLGFSLSESPYLVRYTGGLILVSTAAFIGTAPLTSYHFGILPLWGILINLIVIPLIGLIVITVFVSLIVSFVWFDIAALYAELPDLIISGLQRLLPMMKQQGFGAIQLANFHWMWVIVFYIGVAIILFWRFEFTKKISLYAALLGVNVWLVFLPQNADKARVTFLDVGQGDAALVELPGDNNILIDAGIRTTHGDRGRDVILPFLQYRGIRDIDIAVLSHPHNDHVGGFPAVLRKYPLGEIWDTRHSYSTQIMDEIAFLADSLGIQVRTISAGFDTIIGQARFETFFPGSVHLNENINDHSIVQRITINNTSVLFTGDIEDDVDEILVQYDTLLRADLLKVPHHGSRTSSTVQLLNVVQPEYAVVSVSENNKFDHPSPEVIQRYRALDIRTALTKDDGAVIFESNGKEWQRIHWR
ncbi:MAG: DNA internalization-related competence protein ComEC/Rec2 [Candidatus Marinimicrobia bacterium]|nr:DNA internalization-related competence protein ComEC/Rec2 [Candidatus Neomarinimicrobiota bacterium]MCF7828186.1 DNA internalization-related competence protein ComEC/Rec2 [Candidatus Neomarinimicrobiota bacterium]MCF7879639.1 DNA internalization-related competence protein ComEC/Rec2 [Candidatus Neomarinimicrobiota bacterium]